MDPISSEDNRTTEIQTLKLKSGEYRFGTFTFDFPFQVTTKGVLDSLRDWTNALEEEEQPRWLSNAPERNPTEGSLITNSGIIVSAESILSSRCL